MVSASQIMSLTSAREWLAQPDEARGELVGGQLVEEEMPDYIHELVVAWFIATLRAWARPRGGFVAGSEVKFVLGPGLGRKPDVSMIIGGQRPPRRGALTEPPELMVEVLSPSARDARRDRTEKPAEYAAFGVRHLWLVDPEEQTIEALVLGSDGKYVGSFSGSRGSLRCLGSRGCRSTSTICGERSRGSGDAVRPARGRATPLTGRRGGALRRLAAPQR